MQLEAFILERRESLLNEVKHLPTVCQLEVNIMKEEEGVLFYLYLSVTVFRRNRKKGNRV